jgi:hypothetical protein
VLTHELVAGVLRADGSTGTRSGSRPNTVSQILLVTLVTL